jgi:hypothetical protein
VGQWQYKELGSVAASLLKVLRCDAATQRSSASLGSYAASCPALNSAVLELAYFEQGDNHERR